jgi:hypothetical protein
VFWDVYEIAFLETEIYLRSKTSLPMIPGTGAALLRQLIHIEHVSGGGAIFRELTEPELLAFWRRHSSV